MEELFMSLTLKPTTSKPSVPSRSSEEMTTTSSISNLCGRKPSPIDVSEEDIAQKRQIMQKNNRQPALTGNAKSSVQSHS
jgi:hypothetical protein